MERASDATKRIPNVRKATGTGILDIVMNVTGLA